MQTIFSPTSTPRRARPGIAVLALALAACGSAGREPHDPRTLRVLLPREARELDPRFVADAYGLKLSRLVFASLLTIDPQTLEVVPDLAERVEQLDDVRYRATLRPGLRFSDGSALDASDVAETFRGIVDRRLGARYAASYERIARIEVLDARTLVFTLDGPHATFLTDLELPVLRARDARRRLPDPANAEPVGAGPYRLVRFEPGRVVLRANARWHRGTPRFERIELTVVRDDNVRALRMLAGAADLALNAVPPQLVPLFRGSSAFEVRTAPGIGTTYLGMNLEAPALGDVRVRRALAHAIDREALVASKLSGLARVADSLVPHGHWAAHAGLRYPHDPSRARRLLDQAGWRPDARGVRLRLTLRCGTDRFRQSVARAIAAMLADVGVELELRPTEMATLLAELDRGRFELTMLQLPELIEPHLLRWFFGSEHVPGQGREGGNRWRLRDPRLDAALERGRAQSARPARIAAYAEVQEILAERLPVVPLWQEDVVVVRARRLADMPVPRDARFSAFAR